MSFSFPQTKQQEKPKNFSPQEVNSSRFGELSRSLISFIFIPLCSTSKFVPAKKSEKTRKFGNFWLLPFDF